MFDSREEPVLDSFLKSFKGVKILSTQPLVIETYSDTYYLDAELNVSSWSPYTRKVRAPGTTWPGYPR